MKTRIIALFAGLLAVLPMTSAWASSTHSTHNGSVSVAKSGEGTVYLSTAKNATSGTTSDSWSCGGSSANDSKTFYLYAQPAAGWSFAGWSGSGTSQNNPYQVSLNAQNGSYAYTATFTKQVRLSFQATENGTYSATDGTSSIAATSGAGNLSTVKAVTMTAKPITGYTVKTWWYQETGGARVDLGNNLSYTQTFKADAVVGVEFMVKGDTVLNKTTGVRYRSLDAAVAAVAAGEELELLDNDELAVDVTVPADVRFVIPAAKSYVVPSGRTLTVDGTVIVSGTLNVDGTVDGTGNLVKSLKVITQTGRGMDGQEPYAPYEKMKYFRTAVSAETGTVGGSGTKSCAQSPFVKIVRYNGVCSYHALGASTTVVYCSVDLTVANNCIKDFVANYDTLGAAFDGKASSGGWANAYKLGGVAILLANGSISKGSSTNIASSLAVDCAGKTLSVSAKQINNTAVILSFNATSASMPKLTSGGAWFVNCDSCKVSEVNVNSDYQSNVRYFDCGKTSAPGYTVTNGDGNGGMFFFAGEYWTYAYTVSFKSYYRVYSGLFKNDPKNYLAENDLEVVKEGAYYRVRKQAPKVLTVQVGDQQYETLQEAVAAANGGKITLLQDIELAGDLTVAAGQVCTIELAGFDISGFGIVNRGTLTIEDSSNFDTYGKVTSAITNYGTLKTVYGEYTGAFTAAGGTFTLQGGVYRSSLSGECFEIRSGKFTSNVSARLDGRRIISSGGFFWVGPEIHASKEQKSLSGTDIAFTFSPLDPPEDLALYRKHLTDGFDRSKYSNAEWYRLSELYYSLEPIVTCTTECTLCFDRDVEANTVTGYGKIDVITKSDSIPTNHPAHSLYWTTIPQIWASGNRPISYNRFLSGDVPAPTAGVKNNSNRNIGTTCTIAFQYGIAKEGCWIRDSAGARMYIDWDFHPLVSHDYKFTGGSKRAMIDYVLKDDLQTAVNEVANGGTIMLANDDDETVVVSKEVSFTLDPNNFVLTGEIKAGSGLTVGKVGNVYTVSRMVEVRAGDGQGTVVAVPETSEVKQEAERRAAQNGTDVEVERQLVLQETDEETGLKVWQEVALESAGVAVDANTKVVEVEKSTAADATENTITLKTCADVAADANAKNAVQGVCLAKVEVAQGGEKTLKAVDATVQKRQETAVNLAELESGVYQPTLIVNDAAGNPQTIPDTKTGEIVVMKTETKQDEPVVIVAVGNESVGGAEVRIDTLVDSSTLARGDNIRFWNQEKNEYEAWTYGADGKWVANGMNTDEGTSESRSASEVSVPAGAALWFTRGSDSEKAGQSVAVVAKQPEKLETRIKASDNGKSNNWNLIANPNPNHSFALSEINVDEISPNDQIVITQEDGDARTYTCDASGHWGYSEVKVSEVTIGGRKRQVKSVTRKTDDATISAGQGVWYISTDKKAPVFNWEGKGAK